MDNQVYSLVKKQYNDDIISFDQNNPTLRSPTSDFDLSFNQTRDSLLDPERYRRFIKNAERRFRACKEYKMYKSALMGLGFDHCQVMGNIEGSDQVDIELHHNILNLFDIMIMISEYFLNTIGYINTFTIIQVTIYEHWQNRVPCCFLSSTAHEMYTDGHDSYIPPEMTIGKWWELIERYKYGITFDIANKLINYISKYQKSIPLSINVMQQEQILNFAYYNQYGVDNSTPLLGRNEEDEMEDW